MYDLHMRYHIIISHHSKG